MGRPFITIGASLAFLGVLIGAFGAHALKGQFTPETRAIYETGVQYQLIHAVSLILVGMLARGATDRKLVWCGYLMTTGVLLFSFSLYALSLTGIRVLGAITPFGGLCFLASWALLAFWAAGNRSDVEL